jgi:hypothetical protein
MRYRIGTQPDPAGLPLDQGMFTGAALLSLAIGAGFVLAGLRSRHYWMTLWGAGLVLCSAGYLLYLALAH